MRRPLADCSRSPAWWSPASRSRSPRRRTRTLELRAVLGPGLARDPGTSGAGGWSVDGAGAADRLQGRWPGASRCRASAAARPSPACCSASPPGCWPRTCRAWPTTPAVAVGMGAAMAAVLRLPLASVVLATLLTADAGAGVEPLIILGVVAAYLTSVALHRRGGGSGRGRGLAARAHAADEQRDDRHEVELAEQRLADRERVAEVARRRVVAVADRAQGRVAEVQRAGRPSRRCPGRRTAPRPPPPPRRRRT